MFSRFHLPVSLSLAALLVSCRTAPLPADPPVLSGPAQPRAAWTAAPAGGSAAEPAGWLRSFNDAALHAVVREAVAANPDLQAAAQQMKQARLRAVRAGAARLPEAGLSARAAQGAEEAGGWKVADDYLLSLEVSWEADVWGRVRDQAASAVAEAQAAEADYAAARLSLAANAARAWCNLLEAEQQAELGRQTVESFRKGLQTVDSNFNKGVPGVTALDVRLARTSLAAAESNVQSRLRNRDAAQRSLETLLGRYPAGEVKTSGRLPALSRSIPAGVPSSLLLRRPDIAAAERRIAAARGAESAAHKALLPSFRLTGGLRTASPGLADLLDERKLAASLLESLAAPLYRGGALRAAVALTQAEREELAARYAAVAAGAFREVETAMAAERYLAAQIEAQRMFVTEAAEAEKLAGAQYEKGLTDILRVLESQRRAFDSRSGLLRAENQRLMARIDLCLALGGGFE